MAFMKGLFFFGNKWSAKIGKLKFASKEKVRTFSINKVRLVNLRTNILA